MVHIIDVIISSNLNFDNIGVSLLIVTHVMHRTQRISVKSPDCPHQFRYLQIPHA